MKEDMINVFKDAAKKGKVPECSGMAIGEPESKGPYLPVMSLRDGTEICCSPNQASENFPEYDIRVETPCHNGFKTLRITAPYLDIIYNDGYSEDEVRYLKKTIALNMSLIYDATERGWDDAGTV